MPDQASRLDESTLERMLSWTRLFRGVGAAIDAKKLILAVLGLLLFQAGREGLDRLFPRPEPILLHPWPANRPSFAAAAPGTSRPGIPGGPRRPVGRPELGPLAADRAGALPGRAVPGDLRPRQWMECVLPCAAGRRLGAVVWGIFGGAIARIAVVGVARTERIGIGEALRFARQKWLALIGTPLCPLLGVAFFTAFCAAFGLLYRLPVAIGPTLAGIFAVLPLLAGLVMTIILISLALGWPLMHATIAAESEDGFDALSRSFAYVNQRPLRYAACMALAWALGILGLIVVDLFARTTVHMAQWGLGFGAPGDVLGTLFQGGTAPVAPAARAVHTFWLGLVGLVAHGWIYSYFWTATRDRLPDPPPGRRRHPLACDRPARAPRLRIRSRAEPGTSRRSRQPQDASTRSACGNGRDRRPGLLVSGSAALVDPEFSVTWGWHGIVESLKMTRASPLKMTRIMANIVV